MWLTDATRPPASYTHIKPTLMQQVQTWAATSHTLADTEMTCFPSERSSGLHGRTYKGPPTLSGFDAKAFPSINTFTSVIGEGENTNILKWISQTLHNHCLPHDHTPATGGQCPPNHCPPNLPNVCRMPYPAERLCPGHHEPGIFGVGYYDNWPLIHGNINKRHQIMINCHHPVPWRREDERGGAEEREGEGKGWE